MHALDTLGMKGLLVAHIKAERPEMVRASADHVVRPGASPARVLTPAGEQAYDDGIVLVQKNAFVNVGLQISLDRLFGLGTPPAAIGYIGVSSNTTAVTASTIYLNGAAGGAAANTIIKAISPAASRTNQTVTAGATFANADFTSGVFSIAKVGLLNTSTDAGTGLIDVIGGTGGASPYNKPFTIDLTNAGTFSLTLQIQVTAQAA